MVRFISHSIYLISVMISEVIFQMTAINIKGENLRSLMRIQQVIILEEGQDISLEETLARILAFYREFVQYG